MRFLTITSLITAIGTGVGDEFNIESSLSQDLVMIDADVDGSHIRIPLLTLSIVTT